MSSRVFLQDPETKQYNIKNVQDTRCTKKNQNKTGKYDQFTKKNIIKRCQPQDDPDYQTKTKATILTPP